MSTEVLLAIVAGLSTALVAWINTRSRSDNKKIQDDISGLKDESGIAALKAEKQKVLDKREETYNELSMVIAQHLVYQTDISLVEAKLCECIVQDSNMKDATAKYISEIQKWIKD